MHLVFRWSINAGMRLALVLNLFAIAAWAQLPEGPGREETIRLCSSCHELDRSYSVRQDREGWQATMTKMTSFGMKGTDQELAVVFEYLATNFPGAPIPKLNVNKAAAIEFEARLSLKRSEAAKIIEYREKNGPFKSIADLKKVPGIDTAKIESKKSVLTF